jgi:hypothetical protein
MKHGIPYNGKGDTTNYSQFLSSPAEFPKIKKLNLLQVHPPVARPSFSLKRPTAFHLLLTKTLALSDKPYLFKNCVSCYQRDRFCQEKNQILNKFLFLCHFLLFQGALRPRAELALQELSRRKPCSKNRVGRRWRRLFVGWRWRRLPRGRFASPMS